MVLRRVLYPATLFDLHTARVLTSQASKQRTPAWRPLTLMLLFIVAFGLVLPLQQMWQAWNLWHPAFQASDVPLRFGDDGFDGWLPAAAVIMFLLWMASPLVGIATLILSATAVPSRDQGIRLWLVALSVLLFAWVALPFLTTTVWAVDPFTDPPPGYGPYFVVAGVQLLVLGGIAAIVLAVIGPRAYRDGTSVVDQQPVMRLRTRDDRVLTWPLFIASVLTATVLGAVSFTLLSRAVTPERAGIHETTLFAAFIGVILLATGIRNVGTTRRQRVAERAGRGGRRRS